MTPRPTTSLLWTVRTALAFVRRDFLFETSYKLQSTFRILGVLFQILMVYFMSRMIGREESMEHLGEYGGDYFTFALIGLSFNGLFGAGLVNFTVSVRQQLTAGVMEAMTVTPIRSFTLLICSMLWPLLFELLRSLLLLVIGATLLGARVEIVHPWTFLAAVGLTVATFGSLGVIAGSCILYFKRGDPIAWVISSAMALVSGVYFPISVLPGWLESATAALPMPYALAALRGSLMPAAADLQTGDDLWRLALFAVALVPVAWVISAVVIEKARRQGSLGQF